MATPPAGWDYLTTCCFLSDTQAEEDAAHIRISSQLCPSSHRSLSLPTSLGAFPIVLCLGASPLTQTHVPLWPSASLFGGDSNKEGLFFPEDEKAANLPGFPPASIPERASCPLSTESRDRTSSCVLLGSQLPSPQCTDEDNEVRREGLVYRKPAAGKGSWHTFLEPFTTSDPTRSFLPSQPLPIPPMSPAGLLLFSNTPGSSATGPLPSLPFLPGSPFPV